MLMLMAGYENTANTMIFLAYCAVTEPEVQEKLYQEILETKEKYVSKFSRPLQYNTGAIVWLWLYC